MDDLVHLLIVSGPAHDHDRQDFLQTQGAPSMVKSLYQKFSVRVFISVNGVGPREPIDMINVMVNSVP